MDFRLGILGLAAVLATSASAAAGSLDGTFALQGGAAKTEAHMTAARLGDDPLNRNFDVWLTPLGSSVPIRTYDLDMTKFLHLIVVSDDFRTFFHLHPALRPNGHFALSARLPNPGTYHVYADAVPRGFGQQVFRFEVPAGSGGAAGARDLGERGRTASAGPYRLAISGGPVRAGTPAHLLIQVTKDGKPAADLHPYLGALAHAVFLNAHDLSYAHVHPMSLSTAPDASATAMSGMAMNGANAEPLHDSSVSSPNMLLHVELSEPGTYKLWLQFRGGTHLYVAPFVLTAR